MPSLLERLRDFLEIGIAIVPGTGDFLSDGEMGVPSTKVKRVIAIPAAKSAAFRAILGEEIPRELRIKVEATQGGRSRGLRAV
jgi:hypothetical protein